MIDEELRDRDLELVAERDRFLDRLALAVQRASASSGPAARKGVATSRLARTTVGIARMCPCSFRSNALR